MTAWYLHRWWAVTMAALQSNRNGRSTVWLSQFYLFACTVHGVRPPWFNSSRGFSALLIVVTLFFSWTPDQAVGGCIQAYPPRRIRSKTIQSQLSAFTPSLTVTSPVLPIAFHNSAYTPFAPIRLRPHGFTFLSPLSAWVNVELLNPIRLHSW